MGESLAQRLASLPSDKRLAALDALGDDGAAALLFDWRGFWARPEQVEPDGDWLIWLILAGRGWGKTRTGAEWIREQVRAGARRLAIVGETAADVRDVMVEGDSGILAVHPDGERPRYEPSKRRIVWPCGAIATCYNATEPDQLRGPQHHAAWCDELAKWRYADEVLAQLLLGLRKGRRPRMVITTTPRPTSVIKELVAGCYGESVITRGSTLDNRHNLSPGYVDRVLGRYKGTRLERQEIHGEILSDYPGSLWREQDIEAARVRECPDLDRIVIGVDPAVSSGDGSDETGIVVCGVSGSDLYVIDDMSLRGSPELWARRVVTAFDRHDADAVVVEVNQGGEMVESVLRSVRPGLPVRSVRATRGKRVRAEPISALYEQGRVHHVGYLRDLEDQLLAMTVDGYMGSGSPDRLDAMVWAATDLMRLATRRKGVHRGPVAKKVGLVA